MSNAYLLTNLTSNTEYKFSLEACNEIGCSRSSIITLKTKEMIPLSVNLPEVVGIKTNSLILKWNKPTIKQLVNGILNGYILYVNKVNRTIDSIDIDCIDCAATIYVS